MPFKCGYSYREGEGSVTMDGTEQTVYEHPAGEKVTVELYVDLSDMEAGDSITVKEYMVNQAGGSYVEYGSETYTDAQSIKLLHVIPAPSMHGLKFTAQQTAGAWRTLPYEYFIEHRH